MTDTADAPRAGEANDPLFGLYRAPERAAEPPKPAHFDAFAGVPVKQAPLVRPLAAKPAPAEVALAGAQDRMRSLWRDPLIVMMAVGLFIGANAVLYWLKSSFYVRPGLGALALVYPLGRFAFTLCAAPVWMYRHGLRPFLGTLIAAVIVLAPVVALAIRYGPTFR